MAQIIFSCDVEDPRSATTQPKRHPEITVQLLDWLAARDIRGSFFFVGEVAQADPWLVRRVVAGGHEVGFHSMQHQPLTRQTPALFYQQTRQGKNLLEDIAGTEVIGYRAPVFSLTRQSLWAVEILTELGFQYSSSVLPAGNPLFGLPGAPLTPFRWHTGLVEFPAPLTALGPLKIPFLGGFYLRYLPHWLIDYCLRRAPQHSCLWSYCHPYDFDDGQAFYPMKDTALWVSLLLWLNRRRSFKTWAALLQSPSVSIAKPFAEQLAEGHYAELVPLAADFFTADKPPVQLDRHS